jgi:hypothetical protein
MTTVSLIRYENPARNASCYLMTRSIRQWLVSVQTLTALLCVSFDGVLTNPEIDGVLCSPHTPRRMEEIVEALKDRPLLPSEEEYMGWLSSIASPLCF